MYQRQMSYCLIAAAMLLISIFVGGCWSDRLPWVTGPDDSAEQPDNGTGPPPQEPVRQREEPLPDDQLLIELYLPDLEGRFIVPVTRAVTRTEGIGRAAVEELIDSPARAERLAALGLKAPLPAGTQILGLTIKEGLATIDFNARLLGYAAEEERLVLGSVFLTLSQFATVDEVRILVEGQQLPEFPGGMPGDQALGPEKWFNIEVDDAVEDYADTAVVKLYYCYMTPPGRVFYVPVSRVITARDDLARAAVEELLDGPEQGSGLYSDLPRGLQLQRLDIAPTATIIVGGELLAVGGGRTGEENIVNQLVLTLSEAAEIEKVVILVDGERVILPEGTVLGDPVGRPARLNFIP